MGGGGGAAAAAARCLLLDGWMRWETGSERQSDTGMGLKKENTIMMRRMSNPLE